MKSEASGNGGLAPLRALGIVHANPEEREISFVLVEQASDGRVDEPAEEVAKVTELDQKRLGLRGTHLRVRRRGESKFLHIERHSAEPLLSDVLVDPGARHACLEKLLGVL